jgi:DNA topoisomerase-1
MKDIVDVTEELSKAIIKKIKNDPVKTAEAVNLIYVSDQDEGIRRKKKGDKFSYTFKDKSLKNKADLDRIKALVIPPAWEEVWICALENGHLQVTGLDVKKRKQYRYHESWNSLRNHTKFYRLREFGKHLPAIRLQVEQDMALPGLPQLKILATIVSLMERTNIRVGNNVYEKLYGSFGLTTLKDKHVNIKGGNVTFSFKGKKGVEHTINLRNKKLANIVQQCKDIPGKELFQYYDEKGQHHCIDSGMVNNYIKNACGEDFTAKDFRTWAGTVNAFLAFKEIGLAENDSSTKKNTVAMLDMVAKNLGNTRTVCKKYYVHPVVISLYENKSIEKYFAQLDKISVNDNKADLTADEKIIMKILDNN